MSTISNISPSLGSKRAREEDRKVDLEDTKTAKVFSNVISENTVEPIKDLPESTQKIIEDEVGYEDFINELFQDSRQVGERLIISSLKPIDTEILYINRLYKLTDLIERQSLKEWQKVQILISIFEHRSFIMLARHNPSYLKISFDIDGNVGTYSSCSCPLIKREDFLEKFIKDYPHEKITKAKPALNILVLKDFAIKIFPQGTSIPELQEFIDNLGTSIGLGRNPGYDKLKGILKNLKLLNQ